MRMHLLVTFAAVAGGVGTARAGGLFGSWSAECQAAVEASTATSAQLEACLPEAPLLSAELAAGYAFGGGVTLFAHVDKKLGPAWLTARARVNLSGAKQVGALAGFTVWHDYGLGWDSFNAGPPASAGGYNIQTVLHSKTVMRRDLVIAAGFDGVLVPDSATMPDEGGFTPVVAAGLQYHSVGGFGDHRIIELYGLYNVSSSKFGALASWQESIPPVAPFVFGMEAAIVPTEMGSDGYVTIDVGGAFEL